ncbi:hypothetical protein AXF42_Ash017045 [Apostasia shenzhenica]|uniref:DEK-C domain-containing protein n=1 Tax=Apostasia shenzhenica TaxID=1088818 RepID=A0A2I0B7M9_9ASPA|nr:hypothetical protein AXF42_Ash017045 [Apostasia shenzhenica]
MEVATAKSKEEIEAEITQVMRARVNDFKKQADSLTLEGVRRALEKELGMEIFSLDVHKEFIKHCFEECFDGGDDVSLTTPIVSTSDRDLPMINKETSGEKDQQDHKSSGSDPNEKAEESTAGEVANGKSTKAQDLERDIQPSEDIIKSAILKRASYFKENLDNVTLGKVRRLLEEDLNLETYTLDAYKSFISDVIDEVLQAPETAENTNGGMDSMEVSIKSLAKQISRKRKETKVVAAEGSESLNLDEKSEDDEDVEDEMPKKRPRQKSQSITKDMKKHKKTLGVNKTSGSRKKKSENLDLGKSSENEDDKLPSSSDERSKKKQEKPTTQVFGKHVEHLKSIIKACGMSVPPSVYKRAKQAPEGKRGAALIKELEEILAKEDLSTNPSEKEIKAVKKRKERDRELEGIDMSNIVSTSRRRSTTSYIPTPKPKIEVSDEDEDEEDKVDDQEEEGNNDEHNEDNEDGDNGGGDSSEGSEEGADDESD